MKTIEVKHGMSGDETRVDVIRDNKKTTYIPKGYESLSRLERMIETHPHDICLANYVITITIFPKK